MNQALRSRRCSLLTAASVLGLVVAAPAAAQVGPEFVDEATDQIVPNHTVTPGPGSPTTGANYANSPQVLDSGVNGVGQQIAFIQPANSPNSAGLSLCTGTLINPRTVITAAHCLYNNAAHMYGSATGTGGGTYGGFGTTNGIPLSFGFNSTNRCLGVTVNGCAVGAGAYEKWRDSGFKTNVALNIYNANQVWYNRGSQPVSLGGGGEFANGDIALVTLDTHAKGIPTWTLLFSPLDAPSHATITGYGGTGVGLSGIGSLAGIDYRRRSAENMVDALMSWHDQNTTSAISGPNSTARIAFQHAIYWTDFDDPNWNPNNLPANFFVNTAPAGARNNGYYDFNVLGGPSGTALPFEGSTAGGDSGGPLIIDQRWDRKVIAAVLTGSISYNGGISTYGQMNVYPPLFQFWQEIVANNPYKYASALAGDGDWMDPTHWVQDMDPNYVVIGADGQLVNALPGTPQGGADGTTSKFGTVCFVNQNCTNITGAPYTPASGTSLVTAGGPGSINFVPNNVEPVNSGTASLHRQARYYDVTLREAGKTTLSDTVQIDKLTVDGAARLNIAANGNLGVWAEFNQLSGWTNIDGVLKSAESLLVSGLLSGSGVFDPTYLTVVGGIVAPGGGDKVGTLTVKGDVILASASALFIDVRRGSADQLKVVADADNTGVLALSNGAVVFNKVTDAPAPRHGESYTIASAEGGVLGTFGAAYTFQGVLRPYLSYTDTTVVATMRAGSLVEILDGGSQTEIAFARALDALRADSYSSLYNFYGSIDWMNGAQLSATLAALKPQIVGDVSSLHDRQSKLLIANVSDRLSLLASGKASGLTMTGQPSAAFAATTGGVQSGKLGFGASHGAGQSLGKLPGGMTGFIAGGIDRSRSSYGDSNGALGQGSWHMAMGLEMPVGNATVGTAAGFAEGQSTPGADSNRSRTTMAAAYASLPLGGGFYAGGLLSAESARADIARQSTDGTGMLRLTGASNATRYTGVVEAGYAAGLGRGLTLTPRAQLGYGRYTLDGFSERGGETALKLDDLTIARLEARLGARLGGTTRIAGLTVTPSVSADYVTLLSGRETGMTVRFAAAPDQGIALPLATGASGWAEFKGGVTIEQGDLSLGLSGQHATGGSDMTDQRGQVDLRFRF